MWKKPDTAEQVTDDNIIGCKRIAWWVTTATETRSECYNYCNKSYANAHQYNVYMYIVRFVNFGD